MRSGQVAYSSVPYVLIDGQHQRHWDSKMALRQELCSRLINKPYACHTTSQTELNQMAGIVLGTKDGC